MTPDVQDLIIAVFLVFCRVSACLMALPGTGSQQLPVRIRLMFALAFTLAMAPLVVPTIHGVSGDRTLTQLLPLIVSETMVGLFIGLCGRIFFLALEFAGTTITAFLGFSPTPGIPIDDTEQSSSLAALINATALVVIFASDMHVEVFKGLIASYSVIAPESGGVMAGSALAEITRVMSEAFYIALRIASPFLLYSFVINLLFGLGNKLLPLVPLYFISVPFVIAGGLGLCVIVLPDAVAILAASFTRWLAEGKI